MATNYIQEGATLSIPAPSGGVTNGTPALIGGKLGIPQETALVGVLVAIAFEGVHTIAAASGEAWTVGQRLYWDPSNSRLTTTRLGRAVASAAAAKGTSATTGAALLEPSAALLLDDHDVAVNDDSSAASNGVAVYVNQLEPGVGPVLQFVSPTDANGYCLTQSGDVIGVEDNDDAATDGVALYFDEDADEDSRFQFVSPINQDAYLRTRSGRLIRIKDDDDAATNGVAVYFDEDGAANDKLLFVSPTTTSGTGKARGGIG